MTDEPEECRDPDVQQALEKLGTLVYGIGLSKAETLEVLGRLHAIEVERFYDRRRLEWQLTFTLWAGLVAAGVLLIGAFPDDISPTAAGLAFAFLCVVLIIIVGLHWLFEWRAIVPGSEGGRNIGYAMSTLQRRAIGLKDACPDDTYHRFLAHYWLPTVTWLLAFVVAVAAWMTLKLSIN